MAQSMQSSGQKIMHQESGALPPFKNEAVLDFKDSAVTARMEAALRAVRADFGKKYPLVIDGREIYSSSIFSSRNPNNHRETIGQFSKATREQGEQAILAAERAFSFWSRTPPETRAQLLFDTAQVLRERRYEIDAAMILECGKSWAEAEGDFAEAVDMCEYYGRQLLALNKRRDLVTIPTEENEVRYLPLGVGVIIPPWNFPAAILLGMTSAAVVCGNTVVLKPSSDAPLVGYKVFRAMADAGLPPGVVNLVFGSGGEIGDFLVEHPKTRFVNFTGSKEIGLRISGLAAKQQPGQKWIKRVSAEMGGKDAIIVAEDADLDKAAEGIVAAAFGYQGQKCSACSRAIIVDKAYDAILPKLKVVTEKLKLGPVESKDSAMGAVINERAFDTIMEYIGIGKKEGRLLTGGTGDKSKGYLIKPTIITDVRPGARIEQEEIFGPVLAVVKARDFDEALKIANDTEYGLTGAVFAKDPEKLRQAKEEFHVGNLYLNRKCTGALVGVHPFGGFNMSGTDSKAGGPDYLLLFTQAKSIARRLD